MDPVEAQLRILIREMIEEDLKNLRAPHDQTVSGMSTLKKMHDAPGVVASLTKIHTPRELAHVIEALIDAVSISSRSDILQALGMVARHEKKTHTR
jgi:hypothetical protein